MTEEKGKDPTRDEDTVWNGIKILYYAGKEFKRNSMQLGDKEMVDGSGFDFGSLARQVFLFASCFDQLTWIDAPNGVHVRDSDFSVKLLRVSESILGISRISINHAVSLLATRTEYRT